VTHVECALLRQLRLPLTPSPAAPAQVSGPGQQPPTGGSGKGHSLHELPFRVEQPCWLLHMVAGEARLKDRTLLYLCLLLTQTVYSRLDLVLLDQEIPQVRGLRFIDFWSPVQSWALP
jgi:hypothetical protein